MVCKENPSTRVDDTLDARQMNWPWNVLKAKGRLKLMEPGEVLNVFVSGSQDIKAFTDVLEKSGHELFLCQRS